MSDAREDGLIGLILVLKDTRAIGLGSRMNRKLDGYIAEVQNSLLIHRAAKPTDCTCTGDWDEPCPVHSEEIAPE